MVLIHNFRMGWATSQAIAHSCLNQVIFLFGSFIAWFAFFLAVCKTYLFVGWYVFLFFLFAHMGSSKFTGFKNQQATNGLVIVWRLVQLFSGQAWDCTQLILRCCAVGNLSTRQENGHGDSTSALEGAPNDKVSTWAHLEGSNECLTCQPLVSAGSFKLVCGRDKTWFWHSNIRLFAMVLVQLISFTVCIYTYIYICMYILRTNTCAQKTPIYK